MSNGTPKFLEKVEDAIFWLFFFWSSYILFQGRKILLCFSNKRGNNEKKMESIKAWNSRNVVFFLSGWLKRLKEKKKTWLNNPWENDIRNKLTTMKLTFSQHALLYKGQNRPKIYRCHSGAAQSSLSSFDRFLSRLRISVGRTYFLQQRLAHSLNVSCR